MCLQYTRCCRNLVLPPPTHSRGPLIYLQQVTYVQAALRVHPLISISPRRPERAGPERAIRSSWVTYVYRLGTKPELAENSSHSHSALSATQPLLISLCAPCGRVLVSPSASQINQPNKQVGFNGTPTSQNSSFVRDHSYESKIDVGNKLSIRSSLISPPD